MVIKQSEIMLLLELVKEATDRASEWQQFNGIVEHNARTRVLELSNKRTEVFNKLKSKLSINLASSIFLAIGLFDITDYNFCRGLLYSQHISLLLVEQKITFFDTKNTKIKDILKEIEVLYKLTANYSPTDKITTVKTMDAIENYVEELNKTFLPTLTNELDKTFYKTFIGNADVNCLSGIRYFVGTIVGANYLGTTLAYLDVTL